MGQRGASSTTSAGVGQRGGKREGGEEGRRNRKGEEDEEEGGGRREVNGKESMRAEGAYPHAQSGRRSRDMNHFCVHRAHRAQRGICSVGVSEVAPSSHPKGVKRSAALDSCMQFRYSLTVGIGWYDTSVPPQSTPSVSSRQPVLDSRFQASLSEAPRSSRQR